MTAPIAGFVRPLPDVSPASAHEHANAATADSNGGNFRTALESAMKDKPAAAAPRRSERARRESQGVRSTASPNIASTPDQADLASDAVRGDNKKPTVAGDQDSLGALESVFESFIAGSLGEGAATPAEARPNGELPGTHAGARDKASASTTRTPDGGAWMRAGVRQSDATEKTAAKGADVDDGVDLSPTMNQDSDRAHFVQTAIVELASTTTPNVANTGGDGLALAASLAATGTAVAATPAIADTSSIALPENADVVRRSVDALAPDLKLRLDRVIDRMKSEFGYSVEVVETVRSQSRQDQLFAQGRTTPGEVVTWTRNSKHTQGRAVDVVIDGSYENAAAYRDLAQVAREEGLRSLFPRDGGHLELPARPGSGDAAPASTAVDGESHVSERVATPALPTQTRAAIDPKTLAPDLFPALPALPNKSRRDDSTPIIPKLPSIPASAADVVLPHVASLRASEGANIDVPQMPLPRGAREESASQNSGARLTKMPIGEPLPPRGSGMSDAAPAAPMAQVARASEAARVATVAPVAQVAQLATVAQVANVAQVATVAQVAGVTRESQVAPSGRDESRERVVANGEQGEGVGAPSTLAPGGRGALSNVVAAAHNTRTGDGARDSNDSQQHASLSKREKSRDGATSVASGTGTTGNESVRAFSTRDIANAVAKESMSSDSVGSLARSDATERIARVLKMQESAGDRPLSSVLLRLDSPDGGEDRVRIDLRGSTIGASFDVSDARAADNLRMHTNELQQALQRQGLEGDSITVRTTQRSTEPVSLNATALAGERAAAGRIGSTAASDGGGSTAKDSRNQPHADDWREGASQQRSRQQRRDGKENR